MSERELQEALLKYGQHLELCAALAFDGPNAPYPCSCGLHSVLRSFAGVVIHENRLLRDRYVMTSHKATGDA